MSKIDHDQNQPNAAIPLIVCDFTRKGCLIPIEGSTIAWQLVVDTQGHDDTDHGLVLDSLGQ